MVRPTSQTSVSTLEQLLPAKGAILRGYAKGVSDELSRGQLTLDRRDRLIGRGTHLGLSRFEAALVLAVAERQPNAVPQKSGTLILEPRQRSFLPLLGVAAVVQTLIVMSAWWVISS